MTGSNIDVLGQLRPLTANYLAMFIVTSTTIYIKYKAQNKCKTRFHSQGMILNVFLKNHFSCVGGTRDPPPPPSPLHGKIHLKFPFWLFEPPLMDIISRLSFIPLFFFCNWILHIWNGFYTWFQSKISLLKIDIHQQLRPLTANYLAMFKVTSTTIYT